MKDYARFLSKNNKDTNAKLLDSWKKNKPGFNYELYEMDFKDGKIRKILKMENPSLKDVYHYERVENNITTCRDALAWRMGLKIYEEPKELT